MTDEQIAALGSAPHSESADYLAEHNVRYLRISRADFRVMYRLVSPPRQQGASNFGG